MLSRADDDSTRGRALAVPKVSSGRCGTVLYWQVADLDAAANELIDLGARLYRGPMLVEDGLGMCQLEDPFGNLIGLRGQTSMR